MPLSIAELISPASTMTLLKNIDSPPSNSKNPSALGMLMDPSTRKEISYTPAPSSPTSKESLRK